MVNFFQLQSVLCSFLTTYYCICSDVLRVLIALVPPETFRLDIMSMGSVLGEERRGELASPFDREEKMFRERISNCAQGNTEDHRQN